MKTLQYYALSYADRFSVVSDHALNRVDLMDAYASGFRAARTMIANEFENISAPLLGSDLEAPVFDYCAEIARNFGEDEV